MNRNERSCRRQQEWERRREEILAAAIDLIAALGYRGTTMQDIAARVGCSVGYLYRHFSSKLALARAIIDREIGRFEQIAGQVHGLGLPPLATYRRLLEELSRYLTDRRSLVLVFSREKVLRHVPEAEHRYRIFRDWDRELFEQARRRGELQDIDPELLSALMHGIVDTLMSYLVEQDDPESLLRLPDLIFRLIIDPLRPHARPDHSPRERTAW